MEPDGDDPLGLQDVPPTFTSARNSKTYPDSCWTEQAPSIPPYHQVLTYCYCKDKKR